MITATLIAHFDLLSEGGVTAEKTTITNVLS